MKRFLQLSVVLGLMSSCGEPAPKTDGGVNTDAGGGEVDAGPPTRAQKVAALTGVVATGGMLYANGQKGGCNTCHGPDGKSPTQPTFPSLKNSATNDSVEKMAGYVLNGKNPPKMPAYKDFLIDQEVADIIAWVKATAK
jgi:mono/diheme cytochrome c family protein